MQNRRNWRNWNRQFLQAGTQGEKRLNNIPHGLLEGYIPNTPAGNLTLAQLAQVSKGTRASGANARSMEARVKRANQIKRNQITRKRNQVTRNIEQKALQMYRVNNPNANENGNVYNHNGRLVISWTRNKPQWINKVKIMIGNPQLNVNRMTNQDNMNEIIRQVRGINSHAAVTGFVGVSSYSSERYY